MAPKPDINHHHTCNNSSSTFDNTSSIPTRKTFAPSWTPTTALESQLPKSTMMDDQRHGKDSLSTAEAIVNTAIDIAQNNDDDSRITSATTTTASTKIDNSENSYSTSTTTSSKGNTKNETSIDDVAGNSDWDTTDTDSSSRITVDTTTTGSHINISSNSNSNSTGNSTGSGSEILPPGGGGGSSVNGTSTGVENTESKKTDRKTFKSSVSFHTINVREYGIELGDNPAVTAGPPLTIGWEYEDVATLPVEDYESKRGKRRFKDEMHIPPKQREKILLEETDNTPQDIAERMSTVRKSRSQRQHTVALLDFEEWHVVFETIGRRFRRFRSGISKQREQEMLWEEAQAAATASSASLQNHQKLKNDVNDEEASSSNSSSTKEV